MRDSEMWNRGSCCRTGLKSASCCLALPAFGTRRLANLAGDEVRFRRDGEGPADEGPPCEGRLAC